MQGVIAAVAGLLRSLHGLAPEVFPGAWAWALALLGIGVGLLPAVGAFVVALVRKGVGSRYGVGAGGLFMGLGVVFAGLLPLLVFTAAGRIFAEPGTVLGRAATRELRADGGALLTITQGDYLGRTTVGQAFAGDSPFWFTYAVVFLAVVPVLVAVFVMVAARLALRGGPRWPSKFFWLPALALLVLTVGVPAGTAGQLWMGAFGGSVAGIVLVALAGTPSAAVVHRSLAERDAERGGSSVRPGPDRPSPAQAAREQTGRAPTGRPAIDRAAPSGQARSDREPAGRARSTRAERAAERFAAREPQPPVVPVPVPRPSTAPQPTVAPVAAPARGHRPTLVAPAAAAAGVARFRLIRRLGSGGFGRVWLAHDQKLGHVVALKAAHAPDGETEQRIQREYRALAAVRHPHSVRIFDLVPARGDPGLKDLDGMVLVMEYVEGRSLSDLVRTRGLLDDLAAARVWVNLAGALDAAHACGVLHRDVKPANVVVDQAGRAHLIDFGIARKTGDATMTQTGFVLGTPDFLAPEIACGERATPSSDAWQLAATVSYALTGKPPRGDHADAVAGLRAAAGGAALSHLPRRTAHLALLRAAMDNDVRRRPPLRDVQRALDDWLRRQGASAAGPVTAGAPPR